MEGGALLLSTERGAWRVLLCHDVVGSAVLPLRHSSHVCCCPSRTTGICTQASPSQGYPVTQLTCPARPAVPVRPSSPQGNGQQRQGRVRRSAQPHLHCRVCWSCGSKRPCPPPLGSSTASRGWGCWVKSFARDIAAWQQAWHCLLFPVLPLLRVCIRGTVGAVVPTHVSTLPCTFSVCERAWHVFVSA